MASKIVQIIPNVNKETALFKSDAVNDKETIQEIRDTKDDYESISEMARSFSCLVVSRPIFCFALIEEGKRQKIAPVSIDPDTNELEVVQELDGFLGIMPCYDDLNVMFDQMRGFIGKVLEEIINGK